jgi:60 kDa SS-A/Ro ribonucleoprotein
MLQHSRQYRARLTRLVTPQAERSPGTRFVARVTDLPAWPATEWERFDRFLIFGAERGTYYLRARVPAAEGLADVRLCIAADGPRAVRRIVEVSAMGRVVTNDACVLALAMCAALGNAATRTMALEAVPEVAREGREPARFERYLTLFRGGRDDAADGTRYGSEGEAAATWLAAASPAPTGLLATG